MVAKSLQVLAGGGNVSSNAYLLTVGETRLLLDCGDADTTTPDWLTAVPPLASCAVSHAHRDHAGAIPGLIEKLPKVPIRATRQTISFIDHLLSKTQGISRSRQKAVVRKLNTFEKAGSLSSSNTVETFPIPAGHIPGASALAVEIKSENNTFRLLYTGDFCLHDQPGLPGLNLTDIEDHQWDAIITEGTLATAKKADKTNYDSETTRLREYLKRGSKATVIGIEPIGELVQLLHLLSDFELLLHSDLKSVIDATHQTYLPNTELQFIHHKEATGYLPDRAVVLAPGSEFQRGTSSEGIVAELKRRHGVQAICLNRYEGPRDVEVFRLPTHATRSDIIELAERLGPKTLFLTHGHRSRLFSLKRAIEQSSYGKGIEVLESGDSYDLDCPV